MSKPTAAEMAAALKALSAKATEGPWQVSTHWNASDCVAEMPGGGLNIHAPEAHADREPISQANVDLIVYLRNHALDFADALEENGRLKAVIGSATYCKRDAEDRLALLRVDYERLEADNERYANSMTQLNTANKRMHAQIVGLEANVALMAQAARENGEAAKARKGRLEKVEALLKMCRNSVEGTPIHDHLIPNIDAWFAELRKGENDER